MQSSEDEAKSEAPEPVKDWPFKYESAKAIFQEQARMVRLTAVERKIPLVWLTRTHAALDTLTNFLCHFAKVNPQQIAEGYMLESDFPLLCNACGVVSGSKLRMCEADSTEQFEEIILALAKENEFSYVLCDWDLSKNELSFAEGLVQKGNVTVCWPQ